MFPNQVNIKDLFTTRPSDQFNKMQRDSQDQCGSHTDSAFGGYSQYSQQDYSQPLSQSYSNVYSQPIGRSQAGEREYSPASNFCKHYSNKIQPKISETKKITKLHDYQQQLQSFKEKAKEQEKWTEMNDMFSFVKQGLMEVHTSLDAVQKGNSEVQHRTESQWQSFKESIEKKLECQNDSMLKALETSNTLFEQKTIATHEQLAMRVQQIHQLVEKFKHLMEEIQEQLFGKLELHYNGFESNVNEKITTVISENKEFLKVMDRKQNKLNDTVHSMLTTITNRISESDDKMFDCKDSFSSKLTTYLDEFSYRYKQEFEKRELSMCDESKDHMNNIVAALRQNQIKISKLLTTSMKSNSENLRNLHYQILSEIRTKYGEERNEVKDLISAELHKYSSLFTDNTTDIVKQTESIVTEHRDAQAKLTAEQSNLSRRNSSDVHNIQSIGKTKTLANNENQMISYNTKPECAAAHKSLVSPVAVIQPFAWISAVPDKGRSQTNGNNTENRNVSRYLPTSTAHPGTSHSDAVHPSETPPGATLPDVYRRSRSHSCSSLHKMNLRSCRKEPQPFVSYVDNMKIIHNNNIVNLRRRVGAGSNGSGSSSDEEYRHRYDVRQLVKCERSEPSTRNPVQLDATTYKMPTFTSNKPTLTSSASSTTANMDNHDGHEGTLKLRNARVNVFRGRISKRPKRQLLPMADFSGIFHC